MEKLGEGMGGNVFKGSGAVLDEMVGAASKERIEPIMARDII
jgi:hypothetical protein